MDSKMLIKNQTKTEDCIRYSKNIIRLVSKNGLDINPVTNYYNSNIDISNKLKIFLLFNNLGINEKTIYDAILKNIGNKAEIDINSYNNDYLLFKNLLNQKNKEYTHYIINPPFNNNSRGFQTLIEQIPKEKLIIIGKKIEGITGNYGAIYENFEKDIFKALESIKQKLKKYNKLSLVFSSDEQPLEIQEGFIKFCLKHQLEYNIISKFENHNIELGNMYIIPKDNDLINIVKQSQKQKMVLKADFGIISYNDSPLKKIILNGLTTITSDFTQMGKTVAQFVLESSKKHVENPAKFIVRNSI